VGQLGEARVVEELVQRGKGDIDLELRAGRQQQPDPGAGGDRGGLVQQARSSPVGRNLSRADGVPPRSALWTIGP